MVTQKDYVAIAEIIANDTQQPNQPADGLDGLYATRRAGLNIARDLADYFATDNPRFDRSRFIKACGLTE